MTHSIPDSGKRVNSLPPPIGNHPTNGAGIFPDMDYLDARRLLAKNLKALLLYAGEHRNSGPATAVELEKWGISDSAVSRYIKGTAAANLDHLGRIALAYDLQVWQLLYPGLEPENPPALRQGQAEKELYEILAAGMKLLKQPGAEHGGDDEALPRSDRGGSPDSAVPSKGTAKPHKA